MLKYSLILHDKPMSYLLVLIGWFLANEGDASNQGLLLQPFQVFSDVTTHCGEPLGPYTIPDPKNTPYVVERLFEHGKVSADVEKLTATISCAAGLETA